MTHRLNKKIDWYHEDAYINLEKYMSATNPEGVEPIPRMYFNSITMLLFTNGVPFLSFS